MMDNALASICALKGVHEACAYYQQTIVASTFPPEQAAVLLPALQMVEQTFTAAESIGKHYEELYLMLADGMLVVYPLSDTHLILLLTEKKVNLPLIHMGVKSVAKKLPTHVEARPSVPPPPPIAPPAGAPPQTTSLDPSTQQKLDALQKLLIHHLGPAARWVFSDALEAWAQRHTPALHQFPALVELLLPEFDSDAEKQNFQQQAKKLAGY